MVLAAFWDRSCLCLSDLARALPASQQPLHGRLRRLGRWLDTPHPNELARRPQGRRLCSVIVADRGFARASLFRWSQERMCSGVKPPRPGIMGSGMVKLPVPVTGLTANFPPIPLIAPPPLGSVIAGNRPALGATAAVELPEDAQGIG